jgi:hypothetical protein
VHAVDTVDCNKLRSAVSLVYEYEYREAAHTEVASDIIKGPQGRTTAKQKRWVWPAAFQAFRNIKGALVISITFCVNPWFWRI